MPSTKIAQWFHCTEQRGCHSSRKEMSLMTFPPEPLVQIQNNFTELSLMMVSTKIAQTVLLGLIQGSPEL